MKREAFKMYLKPGFEAEYEKRHNEIWPELEKLLKEAGVYDYSIFWDKDTNVLFAVQKTSGEGGSQDLGSTEIVQKWWAYMADIMNLKSINSSITFLLNKVLYIYFFIFFFFF